MTNSKRFPELGYYALPGHTLSPAAIFAEIKGGDQSGLGSVWLSERFNTKDIGVLSGVAAALSPNMGIASGLIGNLPLRNPLALASYASTMASITDNRFAMGIGRGVDKLADMSGTPRLKFKLLEDYLDILRRLWRGEVVNYNGPAGHLTNVGLGMELPSVPPVIMAAMGDKTCAWAGRHADGVLFNSLWSAEAVGHSTNIIRRSAKEAGRDPNSVKVWTIQVTACETSEEDELEYVVRRMNTYLLFPPMFATICESNGWDPKIADRLREKLAAIDSNNKAGGIGDEGTSRNIDALRQMRDLYPEEWLMQGNAIGSASQCARATAERFQAGADGVLLHGSPPQKLAPLLSAWPEYRSSEFDQRSVNPGLS